MKGLVRTKEYSVVERDIEAELRGAEDMRGSAELRLQQLRRVATPTDEERNEANGLSNSLAAIAVRIRRLRLQLIEAGRR